MKHILYDRIVSENRNSIDSYAFNAKWYHDFLACAINYPTLCIIKEKLRH